MQKPSAQLRYLDLVQWLDNKLGDTNELWSGQQAASLLNREMLFELHTCFQSLEAHVKLKIILALPHISYTLINNWREPLINLINVARRDAEDWIETVSELYRDFPDSKRVILVPQNADSYYCKTLEELRKIVKQHNARGNLRLLPPVVNFISQPALKALYGLNETPAAKHFTLKKSPKSISLKTDQKTSESSLFQPKHQKTSIVSSSFPIRMRSTARKPNNELPMRGIPSSNTFKLSAGFTNEPRKFARQLMKREGGAKLIDIDELPQALKKRRREQEAELKAKKALEKEENKKRIRAGKEEKRRIAAAKNQSVEIVIDDEEMPAVEENASPQVLPQEVSPHVPAPDVVQENLIENQVQPINPVQEETPSYANVREQPTLISEPAFALPLRIDPRETLARRQCEEMLSTANVLDIQGHRMVSAFMSGNKVHPFPQMGEIVTLKLSESYEDDVRQGQKQRYRVETYFQMDYRTGEWKRLKKTRALRPEELEALGMTQ